MTLSQKISGVPGGEHSHERREQFPILSDDIILTEEDEEQRKNFGKGGLEVFISEQKNVPKTRSIPTIPKRIKILIEDIPVEQYNNEEGKKYNSEEYGEIASTLGRIIRWCRQRRGYSPNQCAEKVGVTLLEWSNNEAGKICRRITPKILSQVFNAELKLFQHFYDEEEKSRLISEKMRQLYGIGWKSRRTPITSESIDYITIKPHDKKSILQGIGYIIQQCREQREMSIPQCVHLTSMQSQKMWRDIEAGKLLPEEFTPQYLAEIFKAEERIFTKHYNAYKEVRSKK